MRSGLAGRQGTAQRHAGRRARTQVPLFSQGSASSSLLDIHHGKREHQARHQRASGRHSEGRSRSRALLLEDLRKACRKGCVAGTRTGQRFGHRKPATADDERSARACFATLLSTRSEDHGRSASQQPARRREAMMQRLHRSQVSHQAKRNRKPETCRCGQVRDRIEVGSCSRKVDC